MNTWFGFVEDNVDPLKIGRCRVRIPAIHSSSKKDIPTEHLPWFSTLRPCGISAVKPPEIGEQVKLTPIDDSLQQFIIEGVVPGIGTEPDSSRLARNEFTNDSIIATKEANKMTGEPSSSYSAAYPHNFTWQSPGGNYFELDDTPGAKRIHFYHPSGAYQEFNQNGDIVLRSSGSTYIFCPSTIYARSTNIQVNCTALTTTSTSSISASTTTYTISATNLNITSTVNITGTTNTTGNVNITGGLGVSNGLTVSGGGGAITGNLTATGNVTAYYSDDRLKQRIGVIENSLDKICSLTGFYYQANKIAQSLGYEIKTEVGLSAQDVQKFAPEITPNAPIDKQYLTLQYERLIPYLVEAIKELRKEVQDIKNGN